MNSADRILRELGSDTLEPSPELFSAAARDPQVIAALTELAGRAAAKPRSLKKEDRNRASWIPYVLAEKGTPEAAATLFELGDRRAEEVDALLGAYADYDLPVILLRLGGAEIEARFGRWVQTYRGAPELRSAPLLACGAAWAHGLISREQALLPLREELIRMADEAYAEAQDDEWLDTLLDTVLELHPAGLETELEAVAEYWGLEDDWSDELEAAAEEPEAEARERLRETFPKLATAMEFVERWERIDEEN